MSEYKYIDDDTVKNIIRNRAATLEGQIAEARLNIRLMQDSGEDVESPAMFAAIAQQKSVVRMAQKHLENTERYLEAMDSPVGTNGKKK